MDQALCVNGSYTLIGHAIEHGQYAGFQNFLGYSAISELYQDGLMSACINTVADDMTRKWVRHKRKNGNVEQDLDANAIDDTVERITELDEKYGLKDLFHEATKLVRWFGGCLIFIDTGAVGQDLMTPLTIAPENPELQKQRPRFVPVEPINCFPGLYNSLYPTKPDFYVPSFWWLLSERVHASRFIYMATNLPPMILKPAYNFFGIPHSQILYDYVVHFRELRVAEARLMTRFSNTILKSGMQDILYNEGSTEQLDARVGLFTKARSNDGVWVIDNESEDVVVHNTPLSGVHEIVTQSLEHVAAINRTPATKLLCMTPSGFNASDDNGLTNYNDHIESQQESYLRHGIARALDIIQIYEMGAIDRGITFEFEQLSEDDAAMAANVQKTKSETIAGLVNTEIISQKEARITLLNDPDSPIKGFDPEDVPERAIDGDFDFGQIEVGEEAKGIDALTGEDAPREDTALSGVQISSMLEVVQNYNSGLISRESAISVLVVSFAISTEAAESILGEKIDIPESDINGQETDDSGGNTGEQGDFSGISEKTS